jgi:ribosomal protein L3 glutamine methyltransferase
MPVVCRQIHSTRVTDLTLGSEFPGTLGAVLRYCEQALETGGVFCGHGTDNFRDEAAALVFSVLGLSHGSPAADERQPVSRADFRRLAKLLHRRIDERIPTPYLIGEAWFAGLPFHVDPRVLIPRSPFAELIQSRFKPWLEPTHVNRILEIGTGSGCIAVACALAFPWAEVVATDISGPALRVAQSNLHRHGVADRVDLVRTDLFSGLQGRFDLIISNPPYVPLGEGLALPAEYHHEPGLALFSGADGLESPRRILQDAPGHLADMGTLALEVGAGWAALETAFPQLPFVWPDLELGGEGIALIGAPELTRFFPRI